MASSSAGPIEHGNSRSIEGLSQHDAIEDGSDNDDPAVSYSKDQEVFSDDPFDVAEEEVVSFKRKQKHIAGSRFLSVLSGNGSSSQQSSSSPRSGTPTLRHHRVNTQGGDGPSSGTTTKDDGPLDWYVEGPGRRVGYEDMTAIDWIFEYTKERQRLRMLYSNATGLIGNIQQFLDASQIWVLLILTGVSAGVFAAGIDIASDWLGDLKTGYCSSGVDGGRLYLNKFFCCYGYDELAQCQDWVPWSLAVHITSTGGKWFIEYLFFILFSVGTIYTLLAHGF